MQKRIEAGASAAQHWRARRSIRTRRRTARALRTIRTLAILAPEFVLPQVYERALVALSSDTDAHQAPVYVPRRQSDAVRRLRADGRAVSAALLAAACRSGARRARRQRLEEGERRTALLLGAVRGRAAARRAGVGDRRRGRGCARGARAARRRAGAADSSPARPAGAVRGAAARERRRRDERLGVGERRAARAARGHRRRRRDGAAAV